MLLISPGTSTSRYPGYITMKFRKAVADDIPALAALRVEFLTEANGTPFSEESLLRSSITDYLTRHFSDGSFAAWVALANEEICGTSGLAFYELPPSHSNPTGKIGYIMNMYTKKEYRHKGIASVLFEKMLDEGKCAGVGKFILNATHDGKGLYEKYGFTPTGDEMVLLVAGCGQY